MTAIRSKRTKIFLPKLFNYFKILFSNTESTNLSLEHVVKLSPRELIKMPCLLLTEQSNKNTHPVRNLEVTWITMTKFKDTVGIWGTAAQVINTEYFTLQEKGIYVDHDNKFDFLALFI